MHPKNSRIFTEKNRPVAVLKFNFLYIKQISVSVCISADGFDLWLAALFKTIWEPELSNGLFVELVTKLVSFN